MATVSAPYGFIPISHTSGTPRAMRMPFGIASGEATAIYKYQPIKLSSGLIVPITGTTDPIFGIFAGVEFTPAGGRPAVSTFWPAGQTYDATNDMNVYFWPAWDPTLRLAVQADGAVPQASMGGGFNVSNITAGSTVTGLSAATVAATVVAGSSQGQFYAIEFGLGVNDQYGGNDAFTNLIVGVALEQIGYAPLTSIG